MSRSAAIPRPVSMIGMRSIPPSASPRERSSAATAHSTATIWSGDSTFGSTIPSTPGTTTAWRSSKQNGVSNALIRTYPSARRGVRNAVTTFSRVADFSATATASSRSRMTTSASRVSAFSTRRA